MSAADCQTLGGNASVCLISVALIQWESAYWEDG